MFYKEPGRHPIFCGICEIPQFFAKDRDTSKFMTKLELETNDEDEQLAVDQDVKWESVCRNLWRRADHRFNPE